MTNNTNFDIAFNSVTGPKPINSSDENKDKNQNFTSTMTNNNNTQNNQGNLGFSVQQGIYSQIKSGENSSSQVKSNKLKESEMVLEENENEEKKNENNNINNNNEIVKESIITNGNDKSMDFDKYFGKK